MATHIVRQIYKSLTLLVIDNLKIPKIIIKNLLVKK